MNKNPFVEETRKARENSYKKCGYDLKKYGEYLNKVASEYEKERKVVTTARPKRPRHKKAA